MEIKFLKVKRNEVNMRRKQKTKYRAPLKRRIISFLCVFYILGFSSFLFIFYGPIDSFRTFWITTAMTTMSHQYLAKWFYSEKTIEKVLKENSIIEVSEVDAVYFNGVWNELINKAMQDMSSYDEELAKLRDIMIVMITYRGYDINNKVEPEII